MIGEKSICSHLRFWGFSIFSVSAKTEGSDDYRSLWLSDRASASGLGGRGFESGRAIPKALKMVPVATFLDAQHYKARTGFRSPNKHRTTITNNTNKKSAKKLSPIIINVCIHRRIVWKTGNYAKYVILLKYRDYYYCADAKYLNVTIFLAHRKFVNCCAFR